MNVSKTKTMLISRNSRGKSIKVEVNGTTLEQVDHFKYLGTQITVDAKSEIEIKNRINLAKAKFSMMAKVLTSRKLSIPLKIRMTNCYVFSILMYGAEAWTLTKPLEKNLEAFEMWCMRRIARVSWKEKVTNEQVLERLNTNRQLLQKVKQRKMRYYGHIRQRRHHSNHLRRENGGQKTERQTKTDLVQQHCTLDRRGCPEIYRRG